MLELWGLFVSSFISSTLLPGGSEVVVLYLAEQGVHQPSLIWSIATLGNSLGGMTSWAIGFFLAWRYPFRSLSRPRRRAVARVRRWGTPALLMSWLPLIGDPLCVAAGWLRIHWFIAFILIAFGKGARYGVLIYLAS
jgi:membrane protein YqaA with SNARE-associated domain